MNDSFITYNSYEFIKEKVSVIKTWDSIADKIKNIRRAAVRFPLTVLFLIAIGVFNVISIENQSDFSKVILALVLGVFSSAVAQVGFEHFENNPLLRAGFMLAAFIIAIGLYLLLLPVPSINMPIRTRTIIFYFALLIAFIWIPSIKERADFNDVFMSTFKAVFTSAFFSAVIWGGVSLIITAVDRLLLRLSSNAYEHVANIIWVVWAPVLFLSMIPDFHGNEEEQEKAEKMSCCPKFLEVLISYVLVPLTAVYTLVLLLYIGKTVVIRNWDDTLLQPLILSYCIAVLLLYILSSKLENSFTTGFRFLFPKLLIPIALFQMVLSFLTVFSEGITHTRYFVLMFGFYSVLSGVLLSLVPIRKNGIIAALLLVFAFVSATPPVDAFTVSTANQKAVLQNTLQKNNMLNKDSIVPRTDIEENDKLKIVKSVEYLNYIGEIKSIVYLPDKFEAYSDFERTFGFPMGESYLNQPVRNVYFTMDSQQLFEINGYDYMVSAVFNLPDKGIENKLGSITKAGRTYTLILNADESNSALKIIDADNKQILSADLKPMIDSIAGKVGNEGKEMLPPDQMTFDVQNSQAKVRVIFQNLSVEYTTSEKYCNGSVYVMVSIE